MTTLENLERTGAVLQRSRGQWEVERDHGVDTRLDYDGNKVLLLHWLKESRNRLQSLNQRRQDEIFGHNVFSLTHEEFQEVRKEYIQFFEKVRTIIAHSEGKAEIVRVLSIAIFDPTVEQDTSEKRLPPENFMRSSEL